jgi:tetratricopeptide (TPR) repeat protein
MKIISRKILITIPVFLFLLINAYKTTSLQASDEPAGTVVEKEAEIVEKEYTPEGIKKRDIKRKDDRIIVKEQAEDIPKDTISYETRLQMIQDANLAIEKWKDYEDANKIANAILKERPDDGVALAIKEKAQYHQMLQDANQATRLKRYEEAIKIADTLLKTMPDDKSVLAIKEKAQYLQMLQDAKQATKEEEYEGAIKIANDILETRPRDESTLAVKENIQALMEDKRHNAIMDELEKRNVQERHEYFENLREKSIPYNEMMRFTTKEKWEDIKKRVLKENPNERLDEGRDNTERLRVAPSPSQNLLSQEMRDALNNKKIAIEFIDTPLHDVVVFLQEKTKVNFVLDKNAAVTNVNVKLNDVSVSTVLDYILPEGLDYVVKDNVVHITLEPLEMVVYDVRDLLINMEDRKPELIAQVAATGTGEGTGAAGSNKDTFDRVREIIDLIINSIEPASWSVNGGRGRIAAREGMLGDIVVTHVAGIHKQTEDLLAALRSSADLQIAIEARFIAVSDNFLEAFGNNINELDLAGQDDAERGGIFTAVGDKFIDTGTTNALGAATGLNLTYNIFNGFFLKGFLKAVQESDEAEQITAPKITLSNTQRGTIKVVKTFSYVEKFTIVSQTPEPVIKEIDDGTTFNVRPIVSADRKYVYLEVHPIITNVDLTGAGTSVEFQTSVAGSGGTADADVAKNKIQLPITTKQELSVTVCVPDKGVLMIGGLGSRTETKTSKGVPILSKIPVIKRLFSSNTIDRDIDKADNLIILVQPTILIREEHEARAFAKGRKDVEFVEPIRPTIKLRGE